MGRGRYPARLNIEPPTPDIAARYLLSWQGGDLYYRPESLPELSSPALFGDERPLELDIGCATGELLCALAQSRPAANYLGIDVSLKPLQRAVEAAAAANLGNLKFVQADVLLAAAKIPSGVLQAAYLHFPAPLLRNSQRKQRLVSAELLSQIQRALAPGGLFSVITDQPALYAELLRLLPLVPSLHLRAANQRALGPDKLLKSHYHRRWESRGRPILRAVLERR